MSDNRTGSDGLNLTVNAKDGRYFIPVYLDGEGIPAFTLKFNPGDPFLLDYANNLQNLNTPETDDKGAFLTFAHDMEMNLDAIFGEGSARLIFRYDTVDHMIMNSALEKVREGAEDFKVKSEASKKQSQIKEVIEVNKNAEPYLAP